LTALYVILRKNNRVISGYPAINLYLNTDKILTITAMIAEFLALLFLIEMGNS
jgi:hypothetical protein